MKTHRLKAALQRIFVFVKARWQQIPEKLRKKIRLTAIVLASFFLGFILLDLLFPFKPKVVYSQIILDAKGTPLHAFLTPDDKWRLRLEAQDITPELKEAFLFKEDKYFYYHFGINPVAIVRAAFNNLLKGRRTSGASTLTMQAARMLQPKQRTVGNKMIEMFRALQLEWHYSKQEILQIYLSLVPYGGNIEGVKSAALLYFKKMPNHLSLAEITALCVIPNRPNSLTLGQNNTEVVEARNKWLKKFAQAHIFPDANINDALNEPLNASRNDAPKLAPHFSIRMKNTYPTKPTIETFLNLQQQQKTEELVTNYIRRLYHQGMRNAAVMVINNQTMQVEAYVGSANFENTDDGGQVDGVRAVRSPGSTLKPYLYALAYDKGLITPKFKISDVPVNYSGYAPVNFDKKFNGMVSIEFALANSLNIPAVKILDTLGKSYFIEQLVKANFKQVALKKDVLGLSVILGGCGARLEELTTLYAAFANQGVYRQPHFVPSDSLEITTPLFSPAAAYGITQVLTQLTRPDFPQQFSAFTNTPRIAWKTGTSYGRKDAWSIGYNAHYTIGVWVGNFSGEGNPDLTGNNIATPLLFYIFNTLDYAPQKDWFVAPPELQYRWVCSVTGLPPDHFCQQQVMDVYIPGVSTGQVCNHLFEVAVNPTETYSYCTACKPIDGFKIKTYPRLLPEIVAYNQANHIPYEAVPEHNPNCERIFNNTAPTISSPVANIDYLLDPADNTEIMLACNVGNDVKNVYWYVNNAFYAQAIAADKLFFKPIEGTNKITCVDDKGRKTDVTIKVAFL
ncbi:MAG: penicillin-binding protein 1C [Sphingobacteriales bacterium]|jgi:penicillin-binding protein 1C|nr:penicillin-binding protein 1C [Sphingobacteriales bacterium]MBK7528006.1 penicillin-binding protein 1C [Sphingobacteriales bacterium]MBL0246266.1 penicillin-binding protein 1C [Sphingobacteriales bacterium]MBP9141848.1 penicillin-binding protein 1C [Chitinophagales bacterium]MCC7056167.1 penicillin-binding protein 1C [Chitinophagales bacterium]